MILDDKVILVTGGTGSFGHAFTEIALKSNLKKLIIFSRDELKQWEMRNDYDDPRLVFFLGDVRDSSRLHRGLDGVDIVVHAAALKQIPALEYNPFEGIKTNVLGAQNIMEAAIDRGISKVVALSTDKAVMPVNLYGATKLCSEKLFVSGNSYTGGKKTKFSIVRYGNVIGSRGSVIPLFMRLKRNGIKTFPITDMSMTRFWITLTDAVNLVLYALENMIGGEIFVPKIPSMSIVNLALAIEPDAGFKIIGIRPGEKLHETMITEDEVRTTKEFPSCYAIEPVFHWWRQDNGNGGKMVSPDFRYSSDKNDKWLSINDIRKLLRLEENEDERRNLYV